MRREALVVIGLALSGAALVGLSRMRERTYEDRLDNPPLARLVEQHGVRLIRSVRPSKLSPADIPSTTPVVLVSPTHLAVGSERLFEIPGREELAANGLPEEHKRRGRNDLYITPLAMALEHRARGAGGDTGPKMLVLAVDTATPQRVVLEVLFTAGQAGFSDARLALQADKRLGLHPLSSPHPPALLDGGEWRALHERLRTEAGGLGGAKAEPGASAPAASAAPVPPALHDPLEELQKLAPPTSLLAVVVRPDSGTEVHLTGATVSAGCDRLGEGPAVPAKDGGVDVDGLSLCLQKLRSKVPALAEVQYPRLAIPDEITFGTSQQLREAIRYAPDGSPLFEDAQVDTVRAERAGPRW